MTGAVVGLAALPLLTALELGVLLTAVDGRRLTLMINTPTGSEEIRVLWSLSTAVSEALVAALLDGERRREDAAWEDVQ